MAWLLLVLVLQGWQLPALFLFFLLSALVLWRQLWLVLQRMRYLLLAMVLVTAWSVPGDALFAHAWSPSVQGMMQALPHILRLLLLMAALRWLSQHLGRQGMFQAFAGLLHPLSRWGVPVARLLQRLGLTLFYAEHYLQNPLPLDLAAWRQALQEPLTQAPADEVKLSFLPWTVRDTLALLLLLLLSGFLVKVGR